jgi:glycolate dehydrogenase FAD-binding subunit
LTWPDPATATGLLLGDHCHASAVECPETIDALCHAVSRRVAEGQAIYPQGGRTALDYGGTPRTPGVAVDTRALDRVIDYPAADMTVTVEAGITISALQATLASEGQRLLIDAPHPELATIGAVFATNASGPRRFGAGRPRDQIIGVSFVTSDGALVKGGGRVVKNVAGYDFPRLLTGSMGTLGVIAQVTLKVRPRPEACAIVWATFGRIADVGAALDRLNTSGTRPMAVELLNHSATESIGGPLGLPLDAFVLAVGFEDNIPSVAWQIERLQKELDQPESAVLEGEAAGPLWSALTEFQSMECGLVTIVANLRPSTVARYLGGLDPALWSAQAHAGNGIVRAHWLGGPELNPIAIEVARLRAIAVDDGGNLILSRCPAEWKARLQVWGEPRPDWALSEKIKRALDPSGLMNPGRFINNL